MLSLELRITEKMKVTILHFSRVLPRYPSTPPLATPSLTTCTPCAGHCMGEDFLAQIFFSSLYCVVKILRLHVSQMTTIIYITIVGTKY